MKNPKIDGFLERSAQWRAEMTLLRQIALDCQLTEELKWGKPCYSFEQNNIVLIQGFKNFCALLFTKGALLTDPEGTLQQPGPNTQSARRIQFTNVQQVAAQKANIIDFIQQAIAIEKAGLKVDFKKPKDFLIPEEFQVQLDQNNKLRAAFQALTPGRQRGYIMHFSSAKQAKTRASRVEKCMADILKGKGLNDYDSA